MDDGGQRVEAGGTPPSDGSRLGRLLPVFVPLLLALFSAARGHTGRAEVLVALAFIALGLVMVGVPVAAGIDRAVRSVLGGVSWALFTLIHALAFVPGWLWTRMRGRDGLHRSTDGWVAASRADHGAAGPPRPRGRTCPRGSSGSC